MAKKKRVPFTNLTKEVFKEQKVRKETKRYVIAEGYPWYVSEDGVQGQDEGYYAVRLYSHPNSFGFPKDTKKVPLKLKWGAWKKVRLIVEEVK